MSRLLDRFTDAQLMTMLIQRDFSAVNKVIEDDDIKELGRAFYGSLDTELTLRFPNLTKLNDYALTNAKVTVDIDFTKLTSIGNYALNYFDGAGVPKDLVLSSMTQVGSNAFMYMDAGVETLDAPLLTSTSTSAYAFAGMKSLKKFRAQNLTYLGTYMFYVCFVLEEIDLPSANTFAYGCLDYLPKLQTIRFGAETIGSLDQAFTASTSTVTAIIMDHLTNIPSIGSLTRLPTMGNGTCKVYVPRELVTTLRSATGWSNYAGQILAIEDHTELMPTWGEEEAQG